MYYKAILYNDNSFEVKLITDEEAYARTKGIYFFTNGNKSGTFAIREDKDSAIKEIKEYIMRKISKHKSELEKLEKILYFFK